ncbi:predicted protein [Chaetomium globosum CBS 148.51]|uniref:Uncharacterized protein n=1 Tax=Chaetomium globosum (strain ATCC 6205 / CBS 148.51 / DSM 1962 / NBRC 6347 / NRRL 1970) TaxID=306901 RepID=Q2GRH9_CHAGB|nr:uncharacterized protein CHGG_09425 [Chaetomium globosum CBS 148.51]EAQ85411.1 predicted protein [Chaetomium globosum CBS 148.51]
MSDTLAPFDSHYQPCDELGFSQFHDNRDGGEGSWSGGDDGNPVSRATHPTVVEACFQPQQSEFFDLLPSFNIPKPGISWTGLEASSDCADVEVSSNPLADFVARTFSRTWSKQLPLMVNPQHGSLLRAAGYGYAAISEKMREKLGIEITANALVKRYQKLPKTCESVVANAITNIMPQIMEQLYVELPHIDDGTLSEEEKRTVDRMLQDLPQILPNCVRSSLSRKRRTMQPSPSL